MISKQRKINQSGQGTTEYALIIALVVLAVVITVSVLGESVRTTYCNIAIELGAQAEDCEGIQRNYCDAKFNTLNDWTFTRNGADSWQSVGGKMCMTRDSYKDYAYNTCSLSMPKDDYVIHLSGAELTQGPGYGIFFRLQQSGENPSGYAFQYDEGVKGFVFRKWANGSEVRTLSYKRDMAFEFYNVARDIEIHVKGDQFSAYIDGELILTAADSSYASGGTGFRTWWDTRACFESLSIEPIVE